MKSTILREVNRFTVIIIYLFGLYVILHGHLSPGGGFAGGTIISAGMVLYKLLYNERAKKVISKNFLLKTMSLSLLTYAVIKSYHILHGAMTCDPYGVGTLGVPLPYAIYSGLNLVILNVCVGAIVACTFYSVTSLFMEGEL